MKISVSLNYGINMANDWGADLLISCHVNNCYDSYNGALGCEVIHHINSNKGKDYATKIEKQLANIGFKSRGAKEDTRGLAEINRTNCPCIIVEPFFVEATVDLATYNSVGDKGIANAIVKGITGQGVIKKEPTEGYIITNYLNNYPEVYSYTSDTRAIFVKSKNILKWIPEDVDIFWSGNTVGVWFETQWLPIEKCRNLQKILGCWVSEIKTR